MASSVAKAAIKHADALGEIMREIPPGLHMVTFMFGDTTGRGDSYCVVVGNCSSEVSAPAIRSWLDRVDRGEDGDG